MKTLSEKKRKENIITQLYAVKKGYEKAIEEVFKAYPLDIFPDTTQAEREPIIEKYYGFIDRTSAMMCRHIAKVILERAMYFAREILEDGEAVEHTLAPDVAESAASSETSIASEVSASEAESNPATTQVM